MNDGSATVQVRCAARKDAIVDCFTRKIRNAQTSIAKIRIWRINVWLNGDTASISLDLEAARGLHLRGYPRSHRYGAN